MSSKRERKKLKFRSLCMRRETSVEHETYGYTGNNWSHRISNKRCKERFGSHTRRPFDRLQPKTAVLGTSHIIRKVLQCGIGRLSGGDRNWCKRRSAGEEKTVTGGI